MPPLPQYLQRRGTGTFHVRVAVPHDLRPYLKCSEIKRSLGTRDSAEALVKAHRFRNTISKVFEECRAMKKRQGNPNLHQFTYTVNHPDGSTHSLTVDRDDVDEEISLAREVIAAIERPGLSARPMASPETISAVVGKYVADKTREGAWTTKTTEENQSAFGLIIEIVGDIPIASVSGAEARRVKEVLLKIPPNLSKNPAFRGKSIDEVLRLSPDTSISTQTFNKHISRLSALFEWAKRHGYVPSNPFAGIKLRIKALPHEERNPFSQEDLQKLFGTDVFLSNRHKHPFYYWLPLLGLYTGARIEELCQLLLDDFRQEDGVWVIDINDDGPKRLKNLSSKRLVPIHEKLKELGLLDYVTTLKQTGETRLFPELKKQRDGYSQAAQKWFNARYRKKCGVAATRKSFHSFRHTVANTLKQLDADEAKISAILGHRHGNISVDRYGNPYRPSLIQREINLLEFPITPRPFELSRSKSE